MKESRLFLLIYFLLYRAETYSQLIPALMIPGKQNDCGAGDGITCDGELTDGGESSEKTDPPVIFRIATNTDFPVISRLPTKTTTTAPTTKRKDGCYGCLGSEHMDCLLRIGEPQNEFYGWHYDTCALKECLIFFVAFKFKNGKIMNNAFRYCRKTDGRPIVCSDLKNKYKEITKCRRDFCNGNLCNGGNYTDDEVNEILEQTQCYQGNCLKVKDCAIQYCDSPLNDNCTTLFVRYKNPNKFALVRGCRSGDYVKDEGGEVQKSTEEQCKGDLCNRCEFTTMDIIRKLGLQQCYTCADCHFVPGVINNADAFGPKKCPNKCSECSNLPINKSTSINKIASDCTYGVTTCKIFFVWDYSNSTHTGRRHLHRDCGQITCKNLSPKYEKCVQGSSCEGILCNSQNFTYNTSWDNPLEIEEVFKKMGFPSASSTDLKVISWTQLYAVIAVLIFS